MFVFNNIESYDILKWKNKQHQKSITLLSFLYFPIGSKSINYILWISMFLRPNG